MSLWLAIRASIFAEFTAGSHVCRFVRHQVLLAQFPFELLEGLIQSLHISGDEGAPAGRLTKLLQGLPVNPIYIRVADPYGTSPRQTLDIVSPLIRPANLCLRNRDYSARADHQ
jgi:hypothetical protein